MVPAGGRTDAGLVQALREAPWRFDFFQAVRLLEIAAAARASAADSAADPGGAAPVGRDRDPAREFVRFRAALSRSFPAGDISKLSDPPDGARRVAELHVACIGLTGPAGVLPESYLDLLQQRVRDRDFALRDFLDLFNHRTVSLFYRAWEKYRLVFGFERARRGGDSDDGLTRMLESLIGAGTAHLADRLAVADEKRLRYAGHFAHFPRSAIVLQTVLADRFRLPVQVRQFVGRWLALDPDECSRLPSRQRPGGQFNALGVDTVIGARVWDLQGKFRLRLGPMPYAAFRRFLPAAGNGAAGALDALKALTRSYVGLELDYDVQLVLAAAEVPPLRLARAGKVQPMLGWNTWLGGRPHAADRDDTRFRAD